MRYSEMCSQASITKLNNSDDKKVKIDGSSWNNGYYQLLVKSMHKKVLKSIEWMPRRILPTKDVLRCDKLRGAAKKL